jgi:hypothetical protein
MAQMTLTACTLSARTNQNPFTVPREPYIYASARSVFLEKYTGACL